MKFEDIFQIYPNVLPIFQTLLDSCVEIQCQLRSAPLYKGTSEFSSNASGDIQKPLDIFANDLIIEKIRKSKCAKYLYSEELEDRVVVEDGADYTLCFDPLDGSSNIDCNVSIGTIFSIYSGDSIAFDDILLSGYVIYGFSMELLFCTKGSSVLRFVYDNHEWKYVGSISISPKNEKKIYCINHGNENLWSDKMKHYIEYYRQNGYTQRYVGSMVSDIHRTLLYGGVFSYPSDRKNVNGKLRLLYECIPMSMIMEHAGGMAVCEDGVHITNMIVREIHQKTGIIMGSIEDVERFIYM
jgi:fructose-1,6-bisphosphatase I